MSVFRIEDINRLLEESDESRVIEPLDDPNLEIHPLDWAEIVGVDPEEVLGYNGDTYQDNGEY